MALSTRGAFKRLRLETGTFFFESTAKIGEKHIRRDRRVQQKVNETPPIY